ncbi:MAG TPA: hypothetical protein VFX96_13560, partial [Pyrinomonadaceae bacterium]|nr:hypothetical protein [Pyrinomonadaceae bacterium]
MADKIQSSEITDRKLYLGRRLFMRGAALAASTAATGFLYKQFLAPSPKQALPEGIRAGAADGRWELPG